MGKTSEKIELSERDLMLNDWVFDRFSNSFKYIRSTFDMNEVDLSFHDIIPKQRKRKKTLLNVEEKRIEEIETDEERELRYSAHSARPYGRGI